MKFLENKEIYHIQIPGKWGNWDEKSVSIWMKFLENGEIYKFLENGEIEMNFHKNREIYHIQIPGKWGNWWVKFLENEEIQSDIFTEI